jgi:hypothetical protein
MTEPTTEAKIELLVRSVLEAVDARLDAVRHELASFSNDVEQRHHHLLDSMAALDARITELVNRPAVAGDDQTVTKLTDELERLRVRVDSLVAGNSFTTAAPLPEPSATTTGTHQITREELDEISRPFVTRITTQVPIVPDPTGHHEPVQHMPLSVPPAVTPHFASAAVTVDGREATSETATTEPQPAADDAIDLDQLASLLTERLGSLTLPTRQD